MERGLRLSGEEGILSVGFGNMGQALIRGWLAGGRSAHSIRIVDPAPAARAQAATLGIGVASSVSAALADGLPDVIVLAVKPSQLAAVLDECRVAAKRSVFLSIAAGKTLTGIVDRLGSDAAVVRAMPNTPATIGRAMTALVANAAATDAQRRLCADLLAAVGAVAWLDDERQMDAVTAVSGSGPAYVFLLIECLEQAGVDAGLEPQLAKQLALATVTGAAAYADASDVAPAELRRRVTSPNGTTQAALDVLMAEPGLCELFTRAVRAAAARSRELSRA